MNIMFNRIMFAFTLHTNSHFESSERFFNSESVFTLSLQNISNQIKDSIFSTSITKYSNFSRKKYSLNGIKLLLLHVRKRFVDNTI